MSIVLQRRKVRPSTPARGGAPGPSAGPAPAPRGRVRWGLLALLATPLLLAAGTLGLLRLALQAEASVPPAPQPTVWDVARLTALVQRNDPRHTAPGVFRAAPLAPRDLQLVLSHAARKMGIAEPRAQVQLAQGSAQLALSLPLSHWPAAQRSLGWVRPGAWLNLTLQLRQTERLPQLAHLQLGALPLPATLAQWALGPLLKQLELQAGADLAMETVNRVVFTPRMAVVAFAWPADLEQRLGKTLVPPAEQARIRAYAEHFHALAKRIQADSGQKVPAVPLPQLLQPMFALAAERSAQGQPAERENRAALLTLAALLSGHGMRTLMPLMPDVPPAPITVTLAGRTDTPLHFLVSAALAVEGGGALSDAVGLYKEVTDARGGSGFSFNDLAADRAGTRFGLTALREPARTQQQLAAGLAETALLPPIADLPESMQDPEFARRFGGVGAPAYRRLMAEIESRLDQLPLLARGPAVAQPGSGPGSATGQASPAGPAPGAPPG